MTFSFSKSIKIMFVCIWLIVVSYPNVLCVTMALQTRLTMQQLRVDLLKLGLDRLNCLAERGDIAAARSCFDSLNLEYQDDGIRTTACNTVLKAHAQIADRSGAEEFYHTMIENGVRVNGRTFSKLADAAGKDGRTDIALKWINCGRALGFTRDVVSNSLVLDALSRSSSDSGAIEGESRVSRGKKNAQCFNTIINGHAQRGDLKLAEGVLKSMHEQQVHPNTVTYNCLIKAAARSADGNRAEYWYDRLLQEGNEPTAITYTALISAWGKAGKPRKAERYFAEVRSRRLACDVGVYMAVIQAFERNGHIGKAERWFDRMISVGLKPGLQEFNTLMHAAACFAETLIKEASQSIDGKRFVSQAPNLSENGEPVGAISRWWERLRANNILPDIATFHILYACKRCAKIYPIQCKMSYQVL